MVSNKSELPRLIVVVVVVAAVPFGRAITITATGKKEGEARAPPSAVLLLEGGYSC